MVADPTPLTLANLRRLASWCDLLLAEATCTFQGQPRSPLRGGWRDLLGLEPPRLRIFTTELPAGSNAERQRIQRNGVLPALLREPAERPVLLIDSDELLDGEAVLERIAAGLEAPVRLGLVPLYGAIDRVAPQIHCCWKPEWAALRQSPPTRPYLFVGPVLATVAQLREQPAWTLRYGTPLADDRRAYGVHATMAEPITRVIEKLNSVRHSWVPRIHAPLHLNTMLSAGVHHAGWWIAAYREPEPWLHHLAHECNLRVSGKLLPEDHLKVLRAWSEARLNPSLSEEIVESMDQYVATRSPTGEDFLSPLHEWLCGRPVVQWGHARSSITTTEKC
jgi:hypothetical protein